MTLWDAFLFYDIFLWFDSQFSVLTEKICRQENSLYLCRHGKKGELHIRNKHNGQYDFPLLIENYPPLKRFVSLNPLGVQTINFFNPQAVKALNKALLISYYGIRYWDIPKQYLCPPIPGRADYIHYIADLIQPDRVANDLQTEEEDANEQKTKCRCLDVGVGANCIYPIIGHTEYGWTFVGSDIDPVSIENARKIERCFAWIKI